MTGKHIHVHLHNTNDGGPGSGPQKGGPDKAGLEAVAEERKRINTQKYGGARAAEASGGSNLNQGLKYGPGINKNTPLRLNRDAGTSEGAKKAAQTRKSGGGVTYFPGTEGTHFAGKPVQTAQSRHAASQTNAKSDHYMRLRRQGVAHKEALKQSGHTMPT